MLFQQLTNALNYLLPEDFTAHYQHRRQWAADNVMIEGGGIRVFVSYYGGPHRMFALFEYDGRCGYLNGNGLGFVTDLKANPFPGYFDVTKQIVKMAFINHLIRVIDQRSYLELLDNGPVGTIEMFRAS